MQEIIFYQWKNLKIPKMPSSDGKYNQSLDERIFSNNFVSFMEPRNGFTEQQILLPFLRAQQSETADSLKSCLVSNLISSEDSVLIKTCKGPSVNKLLPRNILTCLWFSAFFFGWGGGTQHPDNKYKFGQYCNFSAHTPACFRKWLITSRQGREHNKSLPHCVMSKWNKKFERI